MEEKGRLTRRGFLRMSAMAAAGVALAACKPVAPAAPTTKPEATSVPAATAEPTAAGAATEAPKGPVTLRYVFVADPGELEVRQACIAGFAKEYPEIKINGELVPEEGMGEKILTQLAGGAAPDMTYFNNTPLPLYASQNVLIPLDDYAARDAATFGPEDFFQGPLACLSQKGKVYGWPYYSGPWFLFFKKEPFDKKGLPYPTEFAKGADTDADTWTWEKMLELAQQVTQGEGANKIYGYNPLRYLEVNLMQYMPAYGASVWSADMTKSTVNAPESLQAHQMMVDLVVKYKAAPTAAELQGIPNGFLSGKFAMSYGLRAAVPGYKEVTFDIGEVIIPKGPKGRFTSDGPNAVGIITSCKEKEAAWTFCKYLPGNKPGVMGGQEFEFKASRSVPTRKSNFESQIFKDNLLKWEDANVYNLSAQKVVPIEKPARWSEIQTAWREQWDAMLLGKPVKQALDELAVTVDDLLKS